MKKNSIHLRWSIFLALFIFAITFTVHAAGITVDSFTSGEQSLLVRCTIAPECVADPVGPSVSSVTPAAIGGERDAKLNWVFGTRNNVATLDVNPNSGHLIFQQDAFAKARAEVVWDGTDGDPLVIDTNGLDADLVAGTNSGLELTVYSSLVSNTPDIVLTITLYAGDTSASQNINISDSITPPGRSFFLPFTAFPSIDPTDVGAISLVIAPGTKGDDITISSLTAVPNTDWGDLPDAYNAITSGANGARHTLGDRFLGQVVDRDADGQPSPLAQGDDSGTVALDDEDGIVVPNGPSNTFGDGEAEMIYTIAGNSGCLVGWIDWNENGTFDAELSGGASELVINQFVTVGTTTYNMITPVYSESGYNYPDDLFARFRLFAPNDPLFGGNVDGNGCPLAGAPLGTALTSLTSGLASNGEIEDYRLTFSDPTAVSLQSASATSNTTLLSLAAVLVLTLFSAGALIYRRQLR